MQLTFVHKHLHRVTVQPKQHAIAHHKAMTHGNLILKLYFTYITRASCMLLCILIWRLGMLLVPSFPIDGMMFPCDACRWQLIIGFFVISHGCLLPLSLYVWLHWRRHKPLVPVLFDQHIVVSTPDGCRQHENKQHKEEQVKGLHTWVFAMQR